MQLAWRSLYGQVNYAYRIGKYEVTAGQYAAFLNAIADTDTYSLYNENMADTSAFGPGISQNGSSGSYTYTVDSDFINRPMTRVSFGGAIRFANWLHNGQPTGAQGVGTTEDGAYSINGANTNSAVQAVNRNSGWQWAVTSEDEWYKGAYYNPDGSNYYLYPTGSNAQPGRSVDDASGNSANYYTGSAPYPIDSPLYTTPVGEFQDSDSPYGTFDQGGNLFEWTEAKLGQTRVLRGGAFNSTNYDLLSTTRAYTDFPLGTQISLGFRVVAVPEPASIGIVGLGVMWVTLRRKVS
jgi:formylglycine-generating enzyme required for sulfatase activity